VHLWVAVIVLAASIWSALGEPADRRPAAARRLMLDASMAAVAGIVTVVLLWVGWRLNLPAALFAAAQSQAEVTRGPNAMPAAWQALGLPLFLLFCGPALLTLVAGLRFGRLSTRGGVASEAERNADARFADGLLIATVLVMLCTVAYTNAETPRLWIPFMPLLALGTALQLPLVRSRAAVPSRAVLLAALVAAQLVVTLAQWVLMDMREAETRLLLDPSGAARLFH
jgi:hypothetical protein